MAYSEKQQTFVESVLAGNNIFLTGKAGTGKSFIVKEVIEKLKGAGKRRNLYTRRSNFLTKYKMSIFELLKSLTSDVWYKIPANENQTTIAATPKFITVERHDAGKILIHHYNYWTRKNMKVNFVCDPKIEMPIWDVVHERMVMQNVIKISMETTV